MAELGGQTGEADWVPGDVREPAGRASGSSRTVLERRGRLDVLVNNAGGQFFSPAELIAPKGWRAVWRLNVEGMLNMAEAAFELAFGAADGGSDRQHHALPAPRHAGDGALGLGARHRGGAHA